MDKFVKRTKREEQDQDGEETPTKKQKRDVDQEVSSPTKTTPLATFSSIEEALKIPFEQFKTEFEFEAHFAKVANFLLNEVVLVVNGKKHRLIELEFYFTSSGHNDPFTHKDTVQQTNSNWYFHRTNGTYRSASYKGLDITIGNSEKEVGGILMRTLEDIDAGKFICGPSLSVDHILKTCGASSVKEFVDDHLKGNLSVTAKGPLYLQISDVKPKREVHRSGRVGLHMTKKGVDSELQKNYVFKLYRYFCEPKQVKKGRHYMISALLHMGKSRKEILGIIGGTAASIDKYATAYESGVGSDANKYVGKKMEEVDVCTAYSALSHLIKL